jgi:hypothetical protein
MAAERGKILVRGEDKVESELLRRGVPDYGVPIVLEGAEDSAPLGFGYLEELPGQEYPDVLSYVDGDFQIEEGGAWVFDDFDPDDE